MGTLLQDKNEEKENYLSLESILENKNFSDEYLIKKEKDFNKNINPLSLQLKIKLNFEKSKKKKNDNPPSINAIHLLKNNKIGILFEHEYISIYSSKTFKLMYRINPKKRLNKINKNKYKYSIIDFIELKNGDLFIWTSTIILIYKQYKKIHQFLQTINEYDQGTNELNKYENKKSFSYSLNSLYELKNGLIISSNSYGLKFYYKKGDEYVWITKHQIDLGVENVIEIKENILVIFQLKSKTYRSRCVLPPRSSTTNTYRVSLYNIRNKDKSLLINSEIYFDSYSRDYFSKYSNINYFMKNKYLFIRFPQLLNIYDLSRNMELIFEDNKKEMEIKFLSNYVNDLILVRDLIQDKIKIYQIKDGKLFFFHDFPVQGFKKIIKINDNTFLLYSYNKLEVWEIK